MDFFYKNVLVALHDERGAFSIHRRHPLVKEFQSTLFVPLRNWVFARCVCRGGRQRRFAVVPGNPVEPCRPCTAAEPPGEVCGQKVTSQRVQQVHEKDQRTDQRLPENRKDRKRDHYGEHKHELLPVVGHGRPALPTQGACAQPPWPPRQRGSLQGFPGFRLWCFGETFFLPPHTVIYFELVLGLYTVGSF